MADQAPTTAPDSTAQEQTPLANGNGTAPADIEMTDSAPALEAQDPTNPNPTLQPTATTAPPTAQTQPIAPSAPTLPATSATSTSSQRNSPHPSAAPSSVTAASVPTQPIPHGSPTRVYLNQNVTPYLLEAMKHLATQEPEKPLAWLSEFLREKSREVEG